MKIPYRWVKDFVALDLSAEDAADRLVNAGIEVESVTPVVPGLRGVVIGEIDAIERELGESHGHRLLLCRVTTGSRRFSVVCGAPNTAVGLRSAFAPPGATLPSPSGEPRAIGTAKIHGVESEGMLCSERELGISEEHEAGIVALDRAAPLGADVAEYLGLDDRVLEVDITPNRPDCLSVLGVARELSALTGAAWQPPRVGLAETDEPVDRFVRVRVDDADLCPRYTIRVIDRVTVAPSPLWMAVRLRAAGLRPISNIVDVTNYVMWEFGQPLHAFDSRTVGDGTIVVRRARSGERITTLDSQDRALSASMLLITDPRHAIGIGGVMGGENTEVTPSTTRILLEAAYFDPASIRRTSRDLGLRTDAAYRFERGADIEGLVEASARAAQLMAELGGGIVARGIVDVYPKPRPRPRVRIRMSRVRRVIGVAPPTAEASRILARLGLDVAPAPAVDDALDVEVPSFRRDLAMEDDLVEEIIRVWGYDKIPSTLPGGAIRLVRQPESLRQASTVRQALVGAGVLEAITYSLTDPARVAVLGNGAPAIALLNPLSQDASLLRAHPLDGLLGSVAINLRRQQPSVRLFEIARTFVRGGNGTRESRWVAIALAGARASTAWHASRDAVDVYDAKGLAELVLQAFRIEARPAAGTLPGFEPDCHGALVAEAGIPVAEFGEVSADVRAAYGIELPVFAALVSLDAIAGVRVPPLRYRPLPRFPAVQRDVAFLIENPAVTAAAIEDAIRETAGSLLRGVTLFDVFRFPDGRRSLAWRLTFQAEDRTLTDEEINRIREDVVGRLTERFNITLRG